MKQMKKIAVAMLAVLAIPLAACGETQEPAAAETPILVEITQTPVVTNPLAAPTPMLLPETEDATVKVIRALVIGKELSKDDILRIVDADDEFYYFEEHTLNDGNVVYRVNKESVKVASGTEEETAAETEFEPTEGICISDGVPAYIAEYKYGDPVAVVKDSLNENNVNVKILIGNSIYEMARDLLRFASD